MTNGPPRPTSTTPNLELDEVFRTFALHELTATDLGLSGSTDDKGTLWLFMGTDSGYAGIPTEVLRSRGHPHDAVVASAGSRRRRTHFSISTAMKGMGVTNATTSSSVAVSAVVSKIGCRRGT